MRVLFLTHPPDTPSTRYRVMPYLPRLARDGIAVERHDIPPGPMARWRLFRRAGDFDAILYQKRLIPGWQFRILRRRARRLVYDFDDPMPFRRDGARVDRSATRTGRFRAAVRMADAVVANHAGTAELARAHGASRVRVIPTPVDLSRWRSRDAWGATGRLCFGWIGTRSNLPLLRQIAGPLRGRRLRIVADASIDLPGVEVEFEPWDAARESEQVRSFDVGLAPLEDDPWNRWKMPYKILNYFAAGVPLIASRVGSVDTVVRDGENGLLAGDWGEAMRALEGDARLRERLGRAGRNSAESEFGVETAYAKLKAVLFPRPAGDAEPISESM
jgi:glycosyltransferase involved in cell wall biosynthesis